MMMTEKTLKSDDVTYRADFVRSNAQRQAVESVISNKSVFWQ